MSTFSLELDQDSFLSVGPIREANLYQSPGNWFVRLRALSRINEGIKLDPAQARAVAHQLLAVADEVEMLRKRDGR